MNSFLSSFESFCDSVDATAAARKHAVMLSLPEEVKLEMKCNGAEVDTMNYEELQSKDEEVSCCSIPCNKAKQQLIQRTQALGERYQSYVNTLVNLGAIVYPKPKDEGTKNDVFYNALIAGLRNKHKAERLVTCNIEVQCPKFLDAVKKLLMMEPAHLKQHLSKIQPINRVPSACEEINK
ncbi:unnamed protein product [Clavelina lepadiformis]|uniref:Uncharacterized protein n=1 Tax=Clavelina lepadiformis TaxID=159417 RepID=A0ABP0GBA2_CLALP